MEVATVTDAIASVVNRRTSFRYYGEGYPSFLSIISNDLLKEISNFSVENVTDNALLALHCVYGTTLERALDLLEKDCVTFLRDRDGCRCAIQVSGSSGMLYTLLPHVNYCPCPAYRYQVAGIKSDVTCKHVLSAYLAEALGRGREWLMSGQELSELLLRTVGVCSS